MPIKTVLDISRYITYSLLLIFLFGRYNNAYAGWPTLKVLDPQYIVDNLVNTDGCPHGKGRIPQGTKVEIHNRYIPSNQKWYWVYQGEGLCETLPEPLQLKYQSFAQNSTYAGGTITTSYGLDNQSTLYQFIFTIPDHPPEWFCGPLGPQEPPEYIGCAFDQRG